MVKARYSGLGIAGFVLGLFGFVTFGITSWFAVALSIPSLVYILRSGGRLKGMGLALAGIIIGTAGIWLQITILICIGNYISEEEIKKEMVHKAQNNMEKVCAVAIDYYARNSRFPEATTWLKDLELDGYQILENPNLQTRSRMFAINKSVAGQSIAEHQNRIVLFFEVTPGGPLYGGLTDIAKTPSSAQTIS